MEQVFIYHNSMMIVPQWDWERRKTAVKRVKGGKGSITTTYGPCNIIPCRLRTCSQCREESPSHREAYYLGRAVSNINSILLEQPFPSWREGHMHLEQSQCNCHPTLNFWKAILACLSNNITQEIA